MDPVIYVAIGLAYMEGALEHFRAGKTSDAVRELVVGVAYMSLAAVKSAVLTGTGVGA